MTLETFFKKFDTFADAPDAIGTLREVILQLAVLGRLVPQSKTDAPVDLELLDKQQAPRKQAEGRSGASLGAITEDEIAEKIPDSCSWVRLFRLCEPDAPIVYGILQPGPDVRPNGVPYVRPTEIKDGRIRLSEIRHTSPEIATQYRRATIRKGDVLLTIVGTLGATAVVPEELDGGNITQSSCRLRPYSRFIDTSYLVICLRSRTLLNQYRRFSLGSAVQRLNIAHVRALAIPLPPLAEQKRIVAKVDELMALCDRLEAQQQKRETRQAELARASLARFAETPTPANLNLLIHKSYTIAPADLRKSILTLAVKGKLVHQDPNDEPAEELLKTISAERERLVKTRQIRRFETAPMAEGEKPFAIPSNWVWTRLGEIGDWGSGSTPPRGNHELYGGGLPWLKSGELNDNRTLAGSEETVTELAVKTCSFRMNKPGDVLLAMYGATIGKSAILSEAAVTNQAVCGCTPLPGVLNTYLFDYLLSQRDAFHAASEGGAQPNISKVKIVGYPFPFPPLGEQKRIVAKVDQLMALVDELETQLANSRATAKSLLEALVAELTTQKGGSDET